MAIGGVTDGGHNLIGAFDENSTKPSAATDGKAISNRNRIAVNVSLGTRDSWEFAIMGYCGALGEWIYIEPIATDSGAVVTSVTSKVISITASAPVSIPLEVANHIDRIAVYHVSAAGTSTTIAKCKVVGA